MDVSAKFEIRRPLPVPEIIASEVLRTLQYLRYYSVGITSLKSVSGEVRGVNASFRHFTGFSTIQYGQTFTLKQLNDDLL